MTSKAQIGAGTKLKRGDAASPEVFTTIAELLSLEHSGKKIDLVEVTNMDSVAQGGLIYKEFINGLADGGEIKFNANYIPADATQADFASSFNGTKHNWKIELPTSPLHTWAFAGIITASEYKYPLDKQMEFSGTIKITGPDTFS
jgi:hypothetical protein